MSRTVGQMFFETAKLHASIVAQRDDRSKPPLSVIYAQLADDVRAFATGLRRRGISQGERVALLSENRPRWLISDLALLSFGAVDVPRGADTPTAEFEYILQHCEAVAAIVQDRKLFDRVSVAPGAAALRLIVLMDDSAPGVGAIAGRKTVNFSDVLEAGRASDQPELPSPDVKPEDLATLVYTSGTTGLPKGVMLTHANLTQQADEIDFGARIQPGDVLLSMLPTWHMYERAVEYYVLRLGMTIYYSDKRWIRDDLQKQRPHFVPCVPRVWESVYDAIQDKMRKQSALMQRLFRFCTAWSRNYVLAKRVVQHRDVHQMPALSSRRALAALAMAARWPIHALAYAALYRRVRAITGGRMEAAVSGGGSLAGYLDDFYETMGIPILNGYGLTETSPVLTVRTVQRNVRGTVGRPILNTEIQVRAEDGAVLPCGETGTIWAHGPQIMRGYYKNEEQTSKVIDERGWFNTGDLGWLTSAGDLVITGRAKDTIVLSSGENVEPEPIECAIQNSPLISQVLVVGQDQKTLGALVVPNAPALAGELELQADSDLESVIRHPRSARAVREEINRIMSATGSFKSSELITRVALISEPFSVENGMLTLTLKPKRNVIASRYRELIEKL